ncbi:hypothetical protein HK100_008656 [Physocladia obscura]|uniref:Uncharacterized protein n=1 Tax=Physocladia obscura TaxID=109957 RepID=A0AAD5X6B2_9FUNG|nr:hypothetical protein HK100_008656 [Physocladia obscura]
MNINSPQAMDDDEDIISLYYTRSSVSSTTTSTSDSDRRNVPARSSSLSLPTGVPSTLNDAFQMPPPPPPSLSRTQSKRDIVAAKYDQDKLKVMEARRLYNVKLAAAAEEAKIKAVQQKEEEERRKEQLAKKTKAAAKARQEELSLPFMI